MRGRRGTIAVNMDDEWVVARRRRFRRPPRRVRRGGDVVRAERDRRSRRRRRRLHARTSAPHAPPVRAAHAAAATTCRTRSPPPPRRTRSGVDVDAIAAGLAAAEPPKMRMQVVRLANGVTLINDAYNANPASTEAALDARRRACPAAPIAVLGEMRELGRDERRAARARRRARRRRRRRAGCWRSGRSAEPIAAGARAGRRASRSTSAPMPRRRRGADRRALAAGRRDAGQRLARRRRRAGRARYGARMAEVVALLEDGRGPRRDALSRCSTRCTRRYSGFNVLRYITFRTRDGRAHGAARLLPVRPVADPPADRPPDRPDDPPRRPAAPPGEGRHADHGRHADPLLAGARDAAARRPHQPLRLAGRWWSPLGFAAIGFVDDYRKLSRAQLARACPARAKLAAQFAVGLGAGALPLPDAATSTRRCTSRSSRTLHLDLGMLYVPVRRRCCWSAPRTRSTSPTASTAWRSAR